MTKYVRMYISRQFGIGVIMAIQTDCITSQLVYLCYLECILWMVNCCRNHNSNNFIILCYAIYKAAVFYHMHTYVYAYVI